MKRVTTILLLVALALLASQVLAGCVGSTFRYQTLRENHAQVIPCKLRFSLEDGFVEGNLIGAAQTSSLELSEGLFVTTLNEEMQFGRPFIGSGVLLGIEVKCLPKSWRRIEPGQPIAR